MAYLPFVSADKQTVLGHYKVFQRSGEIAATLGAGAHLARIRNGFTNTNVYVVLLRLRAGFTVSGAVTTATEFTARGVIARSFTTDFTTAITNINMSGGSNRMKSAGALAMGSSQMGTSGPGICTTAAMSGQTLTADAAPFCGVSYTSPSTTLGASAVTIQVGAGVPMATLYERVADGDHPVVLASNEGVVVQNHLAGPGSGTFALYTEWTWAEVFAI